MKFRQLGEYKKVAQGELDLVTGVCADAFVVKQRDITRDWRGAIDVCEARQSPVLTPLEYCRCCPPG